MSIYRLLSKHADTQLCKEYDLIDPWRQKVMGYIIKLCMISRKKFETLRVTAYATVVSIGNEYLPPVPIVYSCISSNNPYSTITIDLVLAFS